MQKPKIKIDDEKLKRLTPIIQAALSRHLGRNIKVTGIKLINDNEE